jgi:hypothetical protein
VRLKKEERAHPQRMRPSSFSRTEYSGQLQHNGVNPLFPARRRVSRVFPEISVVSASGRDGPDSRRTVVAPHHSAIIAIGGVKAE